MQRLLVSLVLCLACLTLAHSYKPVVILHGIITGNKSMITIAQRISEHHPGTIIYITNKYSGWSSLTPMWSQVQDLGNDLMQLGKDHPEGLHFLGYSQGGLIARAILEHFPDHNVNTFISLSAPQAGQFGAKFLHLFFPSLVCKTAFELFYSTVGQHTSVGNYWNDPHHQELYYKYSRFLPMVNNDLSTNQSTTYKEGITKLKRMVLIGGPDDGVITPWQSSHFGFFDENEKVVEMRDRDVYKEDQLGLRKLDKNKRLIIKEISGVSHFDWHSNITVIDNDILPYLT